MRRIAFLLVLLLPEQRVEEVVVEVVFQIIG